MDALGTPQQSLTAAAMIALTHRERYLTLDTTMYDKQICCVLRQNQVNGAINRQDVVSEHATWKKKIRHDAS